MKAKNLVILTGVAGSGKSTALNAFEDIGYYSIENLPAALLAHLIDFISDSPEKSEVQYFLTNKKDSERANPTQNFAVAVDCRDKQAFSRVQTAMERLKEQGTNVSLIFFDCQDEVIIRRFQETRRPHPLLVSDRAGHTLREALAKEREMLAQFREAANAVIDTSSASPHDLRHMVEKYGRFASTLEVTVLSFGFKYGVPNDVDLLIDVRFLPNPHFVQNLRELGGDDARVVDYVFQSTDANELLSHYTTLLKFLLPRYQKEGKRYLHIGVGCTGGRHRSVAIADKLAELLKSDGQKVAVRHRDLTKLS